MKFSENNYPLLQKIKALQQGKKDVAFQVATDPSMAQKTVDDLCDNLKTYPIYTVADSITDKLFERKFNFLKKCNGFFEVPFNAKGILLRDKHLQIVYTFAFKDGKNTFELTVLWQGYTVISVASGTINPKTNDIDTLHQKSDFENHNELLEIVVNDTISFAVFHKYAPIETVLTNGTSVKRAKLNGEKYVNESLVPITTIDSTWFTKTIRSEGFAVSGHFRRIVHKLTGKLTMTWIDHFEKKGYTRKAKISTTALEPEIL